TRVPLYEAAIAMVNGLGPERALRALTIDAARILEVDKTYGSLERDKAGDVVLFDGDPFEYTTHVTHVLMDGKLVYDRAQASRNPARGLGSAISVEFDCCAGSFR